MIIYHVITTYHILKCAVHKLVNHPDEEAAILIPSFLVRIPQGLKNLENSRIFSKVIVFNWDRTKSGETLESRMSEIESVLKRQLGKNALEQATEIDVCRSAYLFGIYLCYKEIPFQWFEEADGRYTNPYPIMGDDKRIWPFRFELASGYGLYAGDNKCVTKKFIKYSSQIEEFPGENTVDFDVISELAKLDESGRASILEFFNAPKDLCFQPHSAFILTQHFTNLSLLSFEDHALCYQLTADYYLGDRKLYCKWHPSDLMPYPEFLENVEMISGEFPSELMTLVCKDKLDIISSISSTGVYNIQSIGENILTFNEDYLKTFMQNHRYYFCAELMALFSGYRCVGLGLNRPQLCNMLYFGAGLNDITPEFCDSVSEINPSDNTVYLIGDILDSEKENLKDIFSSGNENSIFVFLDEKCFTKLSDKYEPVVKKIHIRSADKSEFLGLSSYDRIFVYSHSDEVRRSVSQMKFVKQLINAGAEIEVCSDDDKDIKINALEGMLKATELELIKCKAELAELKAEK